MIQKIKNIYHLLQAITANVIYGSPSDGMTIIGVTGTDGKTTTSSMIFHILRTSGKKTALISTVSAIINDREYDTGFHVSTPGAFHLQSYIKKAKEAGVTHLVLEVTSHGLDQERVYGIPFTVGVITNISREHLDYHKTMENYMRAKAKLLLRSKVAILNRDDPSYNFFIKTLSGRTVKTYGIGDNADITPQTYPLDIKLFGVFNLYNSLAARAVAQVLAIPKSDVQRAFNTFLLPKGRCEVVYASDYTVIIDFAHTPNGIRNILKSISEEKKRGRIIHVFGSAGERDKGKRPEMGEVSSAYADVIVLTAEDPRHEKVEDIIDDIKRGIKGKKEVITITDRQEAISHAIQMAKRGDFVVITGKGHEQSMNFGKGEVYWSEHEAVAEALKLRNDE